jgi:signal transduction histidine kinase
VDLRDGIESTIQLTKKSLETRRCVVAAQLPSELPAVHGDAGSLNQIFLNLIKNAAESSQGGGVTITIAAEIENDDIVCLAFSDDGPGIGPEDQARLFEPFFTTKEAGDGTGLGLSSSKQIAEAHQGSLSVESAPGEGTTFFLRLPIHRPNASPRS